MDELEESRENQKKAEKMLRVKEYHISAKYCVEIIFFSFFDILLNVPLK